MENENAKIRWSEESIDEKGKVDEDALAQHLQSAAIPDQPILPQHLTQVGSARRNPRRRMSKILAWPLGNRARIQQSSASANCYRS